jgi:hypothetical protein
MREARATFSDAPTGARQRSFHFNARDSFPDLGACDEGATEAQPPDIKQSEAG